MLCQDWHGLLEKISWAEKAPIFQAGSNPFKEQEDHLAHLDHVVPAIYCTQRPDTARGSCATACDSNHQSPQATICVGSSSLGLTNASDMIRFQRYSKYFKMILTVTDGDVLHSMSYPFTNLHTDLLYI